MKILINSLQPFLSVWCWRDATSTCTWLMGEDSPSWWTVSVAAQRMKLSSGSLIRDWRSWMPAAVYWFCKGSFPAAPVLWALHSTLNMRLIPPSLLCKIQPLHPVQPMRTQLQSDPSHKQRTWKTLIEKHIRVSVTHTHRWIHHKRW